MLTFNHEEDTINCLDSLLKINQKGLEIKTVVVDNGSDKEFKVDLEQYKKISLQVYRNKENLGFSGGHNSLYNRVKNEDFDFFVLLNNDVFLDEDFLVKLLAPFEKDKAIGATVPKIYFTKGYEFHKDKYEKGETGKVFWFAGGMMDWKNAVSLHRGVDEVDKGQYDKEEEVDFGTGACFAMKKEVIEKVGLFDENYFLYFEDADLNVRIQKKGFKIVYVPDSIVWHNNAGSSGSGSSLHDYYLSRNRMYFGMKYAPLKTRLFLIKESLNLLKNGREWQKKGIQDYYLRKLGKGSYIR